LPLEALFQRDDGARNLPGVDTRWEQWVSATKTRNHVAGDPLLDWLDLYGESKGLQPEVSDPRTDFARFVMAKGNEFEQVVLKYRVGLIGARILGEARGRDNKKATGRNAQGCI